MKVVVHDAGRPWASFDDASQQQTGIFLDDPIELVTRFVVTHDWLLQSRGENAVLVECGKWCDYQLAWFGGMMKRPCR